MNKKTKSIIGATVLTSALLLSGCEEAKEAEARTDFRNSVAVDHVDNHPECTTPSVCADGAAERYDEIRAIVKESLKTDLDSGFLGRQASSDLAWADYVKSPHATIDDK